MALRTVLPSPENYMSENLFTEESVYLARERFLEPLAFSGRLCHTTTNAELDDAGFKGLFRDPGIDPAIDPFALGSGVAGSNTPELMHTWSGIPSGLD